jgi:hypothetical protein
MGAVQGQREVSGSSMHSPLSTVLERSSPIDMHRAICATFAKFY